MSDPVLIFGAKGQVGRELMRAIWPEGLIPLGLERARVNLADPFAIAAAMTQYRPVALVNAAAYTAVDRAEEEPELAFAANRDGPRNLAEAAAQAKIPLLHLSTDYVFDGRKPGAYVETDPVAPLGVYGRSKEAGEQAIRAIAPEHVILRTAWIFGALGRNFVKTMGRLAFTQSKVSVVADQYGSPTPASALARGIVTILAALLHGKGAYGTFHFAGKPATSWHDFAKAIFIEGGRYGWPMPKLEAIASADFPTPAQRPANSALECAKLTSIFDVPPADWSLGLKEMLAESHTEIEAAFSPRIKKNQ